MVAYNEDWIHFIWTRYEAGVEITEESLKEFIYSFKGSQITDFMMNVNGSVSTADSKVLETFADKYLATEENGMPVDFKNTFAENAYKLIYEKKIDMYRVWISALNEIGINPWISVRTNDCHGSMISESELRKSSYIEANPQFHIAAYRERAAYFDKCLDYTHDEVRKMMTDYIDEMLGRYDVYGLELDMMREAFFVPFGLECQGFAVVKAFMDEVCRIIEKYEKKYGHEIKLALILPAYPHLLIEKGINLFDFVDKVDYITIISRWGSTDTDMPIELWKQLLRGTNVKLGGGQQLLFAPYGGYKATICSVKMAFGQAIADLSRGCDYVYLYNYMDSGEYEGDIGKWIYEESIRNDKNRPWMFNNIGKVETLIKQERSHVVTYSDYCTYDRREIGRLPLEFGDYVGYECIKVPVGKIPENVEMRLILGIKPREDVLPEDIRAYVNAAKCEYIETKKINERIYEGDCFVFSITPKDLDVMYAELKIVKKCVLEYVEIEVIPK